MIPITQQIDPSAELLKKRMGIHNFGPFELKEIQHICNNFGISRPTAKRLCNSLHIPLFYISKSTLFNETAFKRIIYVLTRYGGPGFACPGSDYKLKGRYKSKSTTQPLYEASDKILAEAEDPLILVEMMAAEGRNRSASQSFAKVISSIEGKRKKERASAEKEKPL